MIIRLLVVFFATLSLLMSGVVKADALGVQGAQRNYADQDINRQRDSKQDRNGQQSEGASSDRGSVTMGHDGMVFEP